jgi:hypothetical protein
VCVYHGVCVCVFVCVRETSRNLSSTFKSRQSDPLSSSTFVKRPNAAARACASSMSRDASCTRRLASPVTCSWWRAACVAVAHNRLAAMGKPSAVFRQEGPEVKSPLPRSLRKVFRHTCPAQQWVIRVSTLPHNKAQALSTRGRHGQGAAVPGTQQCNHQRTWTRVLQTLQCHRDLAAWACAHIGAQIACRQGTRAPGLRTHNTRAARTHPDTLQAPARVGEREHLARALASCYGECSLAPIDPPWPRAVFSYWQTTVLCQCVQPRLHLSGRLPADTSHAL